MLSLIQVAKISKLILKIEKKHDVNKFVYKNVNFWPLIRLIFETNETLNQEKYIKTKKSSYKNIVNSIKIFKNNLFNFFLEKRKINLLSKKKYQSIFFSNNDFYYDNLKNKKFNAFIDPYYEILKNNQKTLKVEIAASNNKKFDKKLYEPYYLKVYSLYFFKYILYRILQKFRSEEKCEILEFIVNYVNLNLKNIIFIKDFLIIRLINDIIFHSKRYEYFLKKIKPKVVFITSYYNKENFSIIIACKKLNIKVVDIQHGGFEPSHFMYTNWHKIPKKGYDLLPNFFWVWGKNQMIEKNFLRNNSPHSYILGGKPWTGYNKLNIKDLIKTLSKNEKIFIKKLKKFERVILITLTSDLPKNIIQMIKKTKNRKWFWLIRKHPRHMNNIDYKNSFKKLFPNFEYLYSTKLSIYLLIFHSTHIITQTSSTILDARVFKKKSLSFNNIKFKKLFIGWNNYSLCEFSNNIGEVIKFIESKKKILPNSKISTSTKVSENAFKKLFI